jgi:hypothetical protein
MNETERDRRVDAAWSAASREKPPPSLDAAIRAAARRAVDAVPRPKRDKHWWYPLAAAATVAVLAVGIIQLTPPEQVAPTIVADMAVAPREANKDVARPLAPADTKIVEPSAAITAAAPPPATPSPPAQAPARRAQMAASGSLARESAEAPATERDTPEQSPAARRELPAQDKLASAKSDAAAANTAASPAAEVPGTAAPPRSEPFPAAAAPEPQREAYAEERKPTPNTPAGAAATRVARSAAATNAEEAQTKSKVATTDEAKAKEASARSVEEWIKRIRDLKNEGRLDEAAKALAAFRNEYGERADALLPADLRAMKAQPTK